MANLKEIAARAALESGSLRLASFIPVLIGPPAVLACGTLGVPIAGILVAFGGTYWVTLDALKSRAPAPHTKLRAAAWATLFCALWLAAAIGAVASLSALFKDEGEEYD